MLPLYAPLNIHCHSLIPDAHIGSKKLFPIFYGFHCMRHNFFWKQISTIILHTNFWNYVLHLLDYDYLPYCFLYYYNTYGIQVISYAIMTFVKHYLHYGFYHKCQNSYNCNNSYNIFLNTSTHKSCIWVGYRI